MAEPATATPELPPTAAAAAPPGASAPGLVHASGHRRVRIAMYLAFVAVALAVAVQGWSTQRLEDMHAADAAIFDQAGRQGTLSQQIGRVAALLAGEPALRASHAGELGELMTQAADDALQLDALLARQAERSPEAMPRVAPMLDAWQAARERLWSGVEQLARQSRDGDEAELLRLSQSVQAETVRTLLVAQQLSATLRSVAEERGESLRREVRLGVGAVLVLLGLLALAVVEPTARSVRRHAQRLAEQAAELQRLALVAEHTSAMVFICDRGNRVIWANQAFTRMTGWELADVVGRRPGELLRHPHSDAGVLARVHDAVAEGRGMREQWLNRTCDGRELWLDVDLRPLHDSQGALTGFISVNTDITARMQQQAKLQALWAALPIGVVVRSAGGEVVEANRAAERLLGVSLEQMQDDCDERASWEAIREDGSAYPRAERPAKRTLASGLALHNETVGVRMSDGQLRWLLVNTEPQRNALGQVVGVVTCLSDITERRTLQDTLSQTARTDGLTRLPNRAVVMERLERAIEHGRRHAGYGFAVLFMDFDRFKQVNDTLGHGAGDELLRQIAERLQRTLRPGDAVARIDTAGESREPVAARLGGDEFVVVLEGVQDAGTVTVIAQRLLQDVAEPYLIGSAPVHSSASIGVVLCVGLGPAGEAEGAVEMTAEDVLRNADTAMYEAKRAGRGRWVMFDDSMHERVVRALAVESDLRRALEGDELFVVYQPVVDLASRMMVGVEALVRWHHPTRGLVPPVEFIGVAEEAGLIDAVGALVLQKACTQFMIWRRMPGWPAPQRLAVNLSRAQLERATLVGDVRRVLEGCGMRPDQLQFEVTESLAAQDDRVQATLRDLKSLGVRLALDDFGTGYSSLACLHQLPVDTVKIDRSFVQHAETVEYHRVLIEATIRVARTLGMTTVAEGIETEGQAALMGQLQCDRGQGYLFSRPLEADGLERWARSQARVPDETLFADIT